MTKSQRIPWLRIGAESAAIVASILLAFAIDAWWDGRQLRTDELLALTALHEDFSDNHAQIHTRIIQHELSLTVLAELRSIAESADTAPSYRNGLYGEALVAYGSFDARDGTLDSLIASGRLGVIQDAPLRSLLIDWKRQVDDADEEAAILRDASVEASKRVVQLLGMWRVRIHGQTRELPEFDLATVANNDEIIALSSQKSFATMDYLIALDGPASLSSRILELIDARLPPLGPLESIRIAEQTSDVAVGDGGVLDVQGVAQDGTTRSISHLSAWNSSDSAVITVTDRGTLFAVGIGEAEICATYNAFSDCMSVTVER